MLTVILVLLLQSLAGLGVVFTVMAAFCVGRWKPGGAAAPADGMTVTILKPLHGGEPALTANLQTFVDQDYAGRYEIICGVQDQDDRAIVAVRALRDPFQRVRLCVDPRSHGANGKISNLINMMGGTNEDLIVLSDSDIAVAPDYLSRIAAAMAEPGVGAVTCLYAGRGDAGGWSQLAAAGINYQFLPGVMVGIALKAASPCMGSTIALRRETLERIGGFSRFADTLADDHAIGAAVRVIGLTVAVPNMLVTHGCAETSLGALAAHELRWNATVRRLAPLGYAGSIIAHPLPLALLSVLVGGGVASVGLVVLALAARVLLAWRIDGLVGVRAVRLWVLSVRDVLSFGLFVATFFVRSIDWRGRRFRLEAHGRMSAHKGSTP